MQPPPPRYGGRLWRVDRLSDRGLSGRPQHRVRPHVDVRDVVGLLGLRVQLDARRGHLRLRVGRRHLLVEFRGARLAHPRVAVPAHLRAHPVTAPPALVEIRLPLGDGFRERGVMRLPADGALDLVLGVVRLIEDPAEEVTRDPERRFGHAERRRLEAGHVPVPALVAVELELEPAVGRQVLVVLDELDERHEAASLADEGYPPVAESVIGVEESVAGVDESTVGELESAMPASAIVVPGFAGPIPAAIPLQSSDPRANVSSVTHAAGG